MVAPDSHQDPERLSPHGAALPAPPLVLPLVKALPLLILPLEPDEPDEADRTVVCPELLLPLATTPVLSKRKLAIGSCERFCR